MRRHRRIAALFALVALALSVAESARASVCAEPVADMSSHTGHGMPEPAPSQSDPMPDCPLGTALQNGCAPSASLPAGHTVELTTSATAQLVNIVDAVMPHALRTAAIFHPPRV